MRALIQKNTTPQHKVEAGKGLQYDLDKIVLTLALGLRPFGHQDFVAVRHPICPSDGQTIRETKSQNGAMMQSERVRRSIPQECPGAPSDYFGPANFCWLIRGRFAGAPRPGLVSSIASDLKSLQRMGISVLVTLTREWEPPRDRLQAHDIDSIYCPIDDMAAPSVDAAMSVCTEVAERQAEGDATAFHCHGGRGRTGTLLAAQLIFYGTHPSDAVASLRQKNRSWIESRVQLRFLEAFGAACGHADSDSSLSDVDVKR